MREEATPEIAVSQRASPEPLPPNIGSIQPGGGLSMQIELLWGRWRRFYLRWARPAYVERMAGLRRGSATGAPHEILDPRDLKYCRNQCTADWDPTDDPFTWRERIPFARWGLAELQVFGWPLLLLTVLLSWIWWPLGYLAAVPLVLVVWFFRDPPRAVPHAPGMIVSPADGKVTEVTRLENDEYLGGPAVRIGIFLSIFNVHINRAPAEARTIALRYSPGEFRNALDPASAQVNEHMWIALEEETPPHRKMVVRQISGTIARQIVCDLRPGEVVARGHKFGMIKYGSRTELILPETDGLRVKVQEGDRVKAGASVVARYSEAGSRVGASH
jgi:phosphatidylserine decarboxylase